MSQCLLYGGGEWSSCWLGMASTRSVASVSAASVSLASAASATVGKSSKSTVDPKSIELVDITDPRGTKGGLTKKGAAAALKAAPLKKVRDNLQPSTAKVVLLTPVYRLLQLLHFAANSIAEAIDNVLLKLEDALNIIRPDDEEGGSATSSASSASSASSSQENAASSSDDTLCDIPTLREAPKKSVRAPKSPLNKPQPTEASKEFFEH